MLIRRTVILFLMFALVPVSYTASGASAGAMKVDNQRVQRWNKFAKACLAAHKRRMSEHKVTTTSRKGGYFDQPNYYKEVTYKDTADGRILDRIKWEVENPEDAHVIELYYYDKQGRVIRDYTTAFLPGGRNAPVQTLVAFHHYGKDFHAFRSFDASSEAVYEQCEGKLKGKDVEISLEDYEISDVRTGISKLGKTPEYKACFGKLPTEPGDELFPE